MTPDQAVASIRNQFYEATASTGFVDDDEIRGYLWEGEREMCALLEAYQNTATNTTVTGTQEYKVSSFATNIINVATVTYDGDALKKVDLRDLSALDDDWSTTAAVDAEPTHYYEWGEYIGMWPVPDASATMKIWGDFEPAEITSSSSAYTIPRQFQNFLNDYALYRMYLKDQDDGRANLHLGLWSQHKSEAQRLWARKKNRNKISIPKSDWAYPITPLGMK